MTPAAEEWCDRVLRELAAALSPQAAVAHAADGQVTISWLDVEPETPWLVHLENVEVLEEWFRAQAGGVLEVRPKRWRELWSVVHVDALELAAQYRPDEGPFHFTAAGLTSDGLPRRYLDSLDDLASRDADGRGHWFAHPPEAEDDLGD